jgi:hypothetical protein
MGSPVVLAEPLPGTANGPENVGNERSAAVHPVGGVLLSAIEMDLTVMGTFWLFCTLKQM